MKSNISSKVVSFAEIMTYEDCDHLLIEKYQRPYAWGVEEIEALFQDHFLEIPIRINAKTETPDVEFGDPFVGSIVLLPRKHGKHGRCMEVIDGQQRTTTLSILLAIAYRKLVAQTGEGPAEVRKVLFADRNCKVTRLIPKDQDKQNYERSVSLSHTEKDIEREIKTLSKEYKDTNPQALNRASFNAYNVINTALDTYIKRCRSYNIAQAEALNLIIQTILNGLRIVSVKVDGYSQGMSVFEALNARGQPLTVDQLFKNVLMLTFTGPVEHDKIQEIWEGDRLSFESMLPEPSHRDKFLLHYHRAFFGHVQKRMLYGSFKKIANDVKKAAGPMSLNSLDEYLDHFIRNCRFIARQHPATLKTLGAEVCRPVLMAVREKFVPETKQADEAIDRIAFVFEAALMRIFVCGTGVGRLDSNMASLASDILEGKIGSTPKELEEGVREFLRSNIIALPTDEYFESKIKSIDIGKLSARRDKLMLSRLHQAMDEGISSFWQDGPDISDYGFKKSTDLGNNPTVAALDTAGFSSLPQYEQLSASLGNVVIMPPGAVKAGSYEVNNGLPTKAASADEIATVLHKRATRLVRVYKI
jgi:hypothetical protein